MSPLPRRILPPARHGPESSGKGDLPTVLYGMTPRAENRTRLPRAAGRPLRSPSPAATVISAHQSPPSHDLTFYSRPIVPTLGGSPEVAPVEPSLRRVLSDLTVATHPRRAHLLFLNPCDFDETRCTK